MYICLVGRRNIEKKGEEQLMTEQREYFYVDSIKKEMIPVRFYTGGSLEESGKGK